MDTTTTQVLRILESDARTSAADIATLVGVAEDEVLRIIAECEAKKIIRRYKTVVDWERLGESEVVAFIDVRVS
ncbi:MAG: Lrp/AsnC family transcriptional regulator, partial [Actinomycetota bacterium]